MFVLGFLLVLCHLPFATSHVYPKGSVARKKEEERNWSIHCLLQNINQVWFHRIGCWRINNTDNWNGKRLHISSEFVMLTRVNGIFYVSFCCWPDFLPHLSSLSTFIGFDCDAVLFGLWWTDQNDRMQSEWQNEVITNRNMSSYCFTWIVNVSYTRFVVANSGLYFCVVEQQLSCCTKYSISFWNLFLVS